MKPVILIILDGWGEGENNIANPLTEANLPTLRQIQETYPKMLLAASGISVGLLWGEPGNSEAGHLNLGAGKIVYQYLPRIILSIRDESFFKNPAFIKAADHVRKHASRLHMMGLLSSGSVHSYADHLTALLDFAARSGLADRTIIHIFTDGRDAPLKEGKIFIKDLVERLKTEGGSRLGSLMGRKYAMNRNAEWNLTQTAYDLLTKGEGASIADPITYIDSQYKKDITDEYIEPAIVEGQTPLGGSDPPRVPLIQDGDAVIFFNYREDSARQLTEAFVLDDFKEFPREKIANLFFVTMTEYEKNLPVEIAFRPIKILKPLARVISDAGLKQLHIAETEKYAHVTYFFNGLKETPFQGEDRVLVPSRSVKSFAEIPHMRTQDIAFKVVTAIKLKRYAFILANFAASDMVAHTGDFKACARAAESIDEAIRAIQEAAEKYHTTLIMTADHGNIEEMLDLRTGEVKTEHTINPVPCFLIDESVKNRSFPKTASPEHGTHGMLADVAPTILELLELEKPEEMTGQSLLRLLH